MIVTRNWLQEWVDLDGITTDDICKKLNSIGLEVDSLTRFRVPEKIVVGYVKSCEKHPDADKLTVCQIDLGTATRQIVCGAKNIREGLYVPVATVGAVMPNGMKIKHAKLRGVESDGMVCSSTELGLPKIGEGILELDESIGKLEIGKALCEYSLLNDDMIEIELTANRGDCLSIHGVARELSVGFDRSIIPFEFKQDENNHLGIGRILQFMHEGNPPVSLIYRAANLANLRIPLLVRLRLAMIEQDAANGLEAFCNYAIHTTGVVLRHYDFSKLSCAKEKVKLVLKELDNGLGAVEYDGKIASIVGINQDETLKAERDEGVVLLEASYIAPDIIAPVVKKEGLETDALYYRTSRGSEPDLEFGLNFLLSLLGQWSDAEVYAGCSEFITPKELHTLKITVEEIERLIGQQIELSVIVNILSRLGFVIHKTEDGQIILDTPSFRHDIENRQDVIEEIVRIVGIDNIASKPLRFQEANRNSLALQRYKYLRDLRLKAVANGFFETVHYVFCDNKKLRQLGFEPLKEEKALLNPITNEMDGLRPSLMVTMLDSLQRNVSMSKKRIPLFEIGKVFDTERNEAFHFLLAYAGEKEMEAVTNAGKPEPIDFASFVDKVAAVIGPFELKKGSAENGLLHPYQSAEIWIDGKRAGVVSKLHPTVADAYDLPDTFFAELDVSNLEAKHIHAKAISAYTPVQRDISIVVPQTMPYTQIKEALEGNLPESVKQFFPIDRYVDESLGEWMSLTLRFMISSMEKTLEESEINAIMDDVLKILEKRCEAKLR
ncbi:phenylalanine--tRNA ligase subunit beta [Hydrogenimonas cancrithermarum]|uniref:Phenylalanine--tRNA ligase beta subunit n=1 Tax=Hydrogenimonas cancrithermarum TaxID=2993563 RepID=A0ABN6WZL8_9BACT|nr:phenylalanine--tRNA ligase subunit beta [Hydrogenimonas cancrithermarum]BDY13845.1 phenylalanine--tRNA ligase beta subunit [Hydrogenimonas cancrithermarum]